MRLCFDLDGTICSHREDGDYARAQPHREVVEKVRALSDEGHYIIVDTARGSITGEDHYELTARQLREWGVPFDELRCGEKPYAEIYIDSSALRPGEL